MTRYQNAEPVHRERMTTFSLSEPLPPAIEASPPAAEAQPVAAPAVAPPVALEIPRQVVMMAAPFEAERPPVARAVPTANAAAAPAPLPQPAAPAPAPIVPPDFTASQLRNPGPAYPYLSRRAKEQGVVLLKVLVSTDGKAERLQVEESSGFDRLDDAALKTVAKWRFMPATQAGQPREAWVIVPVTFSLG